MADKDIVIPNILYCPENIFSNKIAALDVNFINPGTYGDAYGSSNSDSAKSTAATLQTVVATWYKTFRNVAIVGLLSVLVYIGIRILLGSTAEDKAKYKERLKDWLVGLCLLFVMHYIMAGTMMIIENITTMLDKSLNPNLVVNLENINKEGTSEESGGNIRFKTNLMGYMRFMTQSLNWGDAAAYTIIYIALVIYTVMFTITYLKRVLYMAFFTMIAPLVALTYPIDKIADGKAQGFNMWFKEYMMNAIIQPVHLILYIVLMDSAMSLAIDNPIYALVAIGFLIPAEKFIKKMFRLDRGETTSTLGAVAGGALAMKGIQGVSKISKSIAGGNGKNSDKIRTADKPELNSGNSRGKNEGIPSPDSVLASEGGNYIRENQGNNDNENNSFDPRLTSEQREELQSEGIRPGDAEYNQYLSEHGIAQRANERENNGANQQTDTQVQAAPEVINGLREPNISEEQSQQTQDQSRINIPTPEEATAPQRFTGNSMKDKIKNSRVGRTVQRMPNNLKNKAIKGVKKLPRMAIKAGATVAGGIAVGTLAAGAALTTGDLKSAASMMGAGAAIGGSLGNAVGNRMSNSIEDSAKRNYETVKEAWYTEDEKKERKQRQKDKYDENWKLQEENYKYLHSKGMNNKQAKEFLEDEKTQKFLDANVTDVNMIYNARKLMDKSNGKMTIDGAVARAQFAKDASENFKTNYSEQNAFKKNIKSKNSQFNDTQLNNLVDDIIAIKKTES